MILATALLLGGVVIGWWGPRALHSLSGVVDPAIVIVCWLAAMVGTGVTVLAGGLLLVLPGHGPAGTITQAMHHCWAALGHSHLPQLDPAVAALSLAVAAVVLVRMAASTARTARRQDAVRRPHLEALRILRPSRDGVAPMLWIEHDRPMAYSLGGRDALIVATRSLADRLSPDELRAVLAHEHAHLHGRHHQVIAIAETVAKALGFVPLMRLAPGVLRLQVELAADRAAVRECGRGAVRSALLTLTAQSTLPGALAMAGGETAARLRHLERTDTWPRAVRHFVTGVAAVLAVALPTLTAFALLGALSVLVCPLLPSAG
ncbi:Peptidase family M48 [Amycolatopsis marina]|uniref:Peptidase family M48 n=1 Tax=Amycolatopsis marina TaxID=490629 RepID=A0A1I0YUV0_9PSEU|nr:M56 family metallopeptidase [Amycolatopsis marina]SFB16200.1 Peptidase family M48 [Amycolatopsis marina]